MRNEDKAKTEAKITEQSHRYKVIKDYQTQFLDPISVRSGGTLMVSEKVDYWNGNPDWIWIWCTDQRGKSSWVPKNAIDFDADGKSGTAHYDYSAMELNVTVGDELVVEHEESGWFWCTNQRGKSGWVPVDCVTES